MHKSTLSNQAFGGRLVIRRPDLNYECHAISNKANKILAIFQGSSDHFPVYSIFVFCLGYIHDFLDTSRVGKLPIIIMAYRIKVFLFPILILVKTFSQVKPPCKNLTILNQEKLFKKN